MIFIILYIILLALILIFNYVVHLNAKIDLEDFDENVTSTGTSLSFEKINLVNSDGNATSTSTLGFQ